MKNYEKSYFLMCREAIGIVDSYTYLGIKFSYNGRLCTVKTNN